MIRGGRRRPRAVALTLTQKHVFEILNLAVHFLVFVHDGAVLPLELRATDVGVVLRDDRLE